MQTVEEFCDISDAILIIIEKLKLKVCYDSLEIHKYSYKLS